MPSFLRIVLALGVQQRVLSGLRHEQKQLEAAAATLQVTDRVQFLGPLSDAEVVAHLHACDVFVLPSACILVRADLLREIWQSFAVLPAVRSVGVMGDGRTYDYVVALRAVQTTDFMTAHWAMHHKARLRPGEDVAVCTLVLRYPPYLPLRTFRDAELTSYFSVCPAPEVSENDGFSLHLG